MWLNLEKPWLFGKWCLNHQHSGCSRWRTYIYMEMVLTKKWSIPAYPEVASLNHTFLKCLGSPFLSKPNIFMLWCSMFVLEMFPESSTDPRWRPVKALMPHRAGHERKMYRFVWPNKLQKQQFRTAICQLPHCRDQLRQRVLCPECPGAQRMPYFGCLGPKFPRNCNAQIPSLELSVPNWPRGCHDGPSRGKYYLESRDYHWAPLEALGPSNSLFPRSFICSKQRLSVFS